MSVGGSKSSGSQDLFFFNGQTDLAEAAIQDIGRRVFGGGPSVAAESQAIRGEERVRQQSARSGFSANDPITQRKLAIVEGQRQMSESQQRDQLIATLLNPAGSVGKQSGKSAGVSAG